MLALEPASAAATKAESFEEGFLVAYPDPDVAAAEFGDDPPRLALRLLTRIGPLVHIDEDGAVRVYVGKAEVGQNMRAAVVQLAAETLHMAPASIAVIAADTARVPYDAQSAAGSGRGRVECRRTTLQLENDLVVHPATCRT